MRLNSTSSITTYFIFVEIILATLTLQCCTWDSTNTGKRKCNESEIASISGRKMQPKAKIRILRKMNVCSDTGKIMLHCLLSQQYAILNDYNYLTSVRKDSELITSINSNLGNPYSYLLWTMLDLDQKSDYSNLQLVVNLVQDSPDYFKFKVDTSVINKPIHFEFRH